MSVYFPIGSDERYVIYTPHEEYHLLEFNSPPDNRFNPETIPAIIEAITYIQTEGEPLPLITTSTSPKFYSNGLDFERAISTPNFFSEHYYPLMRVFLEFPWPTVALVNGHAFAAGFMIAECHDYIVMNPNKGFLCMNELKFGAPLMGPLMSIFRARYGGQIAHKITMTAHRFTAQEALDLGIITTKGGLPEAQLIVREITEFAQSPSYGSIRRELFREVIADLLSYDEDEQRKDEMREQSQAFYDAVIKNYKSKL